MRGHHLGVQDISWGARGGTRLIVGCVGEESEAGEVGIRVA